jgi:hypothetical protein
MKVAASTLLLLLCLQLHEPAVSSHKSLKRTPQLRLLLQR